MEQLPTEICGFWNLNFFIETIEKEFHEILSKSTTSAAKLFVIKDQNLFNQIISKLKEEHYLFADNFPLLTVFSKLTIIKSELQVKICYSDMNSKCTHCWISFTRLSHYLRQFETEIYRMRIVFDKPISLEQWMNWFGNQMKKLSLEATLHHNKHAITLTRQTPCQWVKMYNHKSQWEYLQLHFDIDMIHSNMCYVMETFITDSSITSIVCTFLPRVPVKYLRNYVVTFNALAKKIYSNTEKKENQIFQDEENEKTVSNVLVTHYKDQNCLVFFPLYF